MCTASLTFNNSTFCPHSVFMCFVWISEQTAIISLHNINPPLSITNPQYVYHSVPSHTIHIHNPSPSQCCLPAASAQPRPSCHQPSQPRPSCHQPSQPRPSCHQSSQQRRSWFSCPQATAQTVPNIPSCHCTPLLQSSLFKFTKINLLPLKFR